MVKSDSERAEFLKNNLGLVHSCANKFRSRGLEYDDMFSAGCVGLIKAFDSFDENRGVMFSTYAVPVILGEIKRLFRDGGAIKVSRSLKELSLKAARQRDYFAKKNGREPTVSELAKMLEESEESVIEALNIGVPPISLTADTEDGRTEIDITYDLNDDMICDRISIADALHRLNEKDRRLILLRYYKGKTQTETAAELDMSQVQVSRMEKKILLAMRQRLCD